MIVLKYFIVGFYLLAHIGLISAGSQQILISYQRYGVMPDTTVIKKDQKQYGIFIQYNRKKLPSFLMAIPRLACVVTAIKNNQYQQYFLNEPIDPFPLDEQYTFFTPLDFATKLRVNNVYEQGYLIENKQFYLVDNVQCKLVIGDKDFTEGISNAITIPKSDITQTADKH